MYQKQEEEDSMADQGRTSGPTKGGQGGKSAGKTGMAAGHTFKTLGSGKTHKASGLAALTRRGKQ